MGTVKNFGGLNSPVAEVEGGTNAKTFDAARTNMGVNPLIVEKTLTYNVVSSDRGTLIHYTGAGGVDLTLDPAATLGNGFNFDIRNDSAANITINPNGAETINGAATLAVEPTQAVTVICSGTEFFTEGQAAQVDGANVALSNLASTAVNVDIVPAVNGGPDLGDSSHYWGTVYAQTLSDGTLTNTEAPGTNDDTIATTAFVAAGLSTVSLPSMKAIAGNYYLVQIAGLFDIANITDSATVGQAPQLVSHVFFYPFYVYRTTSYDRIGLIIQTLEAASEATVGIYTSDTNALPTGASLATAVLSGAASGSVEGTISVTLNPGIYWFAIQCSSDVTLSLKGAFTTGGQGAVSGLGLGLISSSLSVNSYLGYEQTNTYSSGVLPTVGSIGASTFNGFCAATYLRAS